MICMLFFFVLVLLVFVTVDPALAHPKILSTYPQTLVPTSNEDSKTFFQEYFISSLIVVIAVTMTITVSIIYREDLFIKR